MTWQKLSGFDASKGPGYVMALSLTLENKDGEEYETSVAPARNDYDLMDLTEDLETGEVEWVSIDFDAPRKPAFDAVATAESIEDVEPERGL